MKKLMTKHFSKWALKQNIPDNELSKALAEVQKGKFEANLGGNVFKKESVLREKVKVAAVEQFFATRIKKGLFLFMVLRKMKNQIYRRKSL